MAGAGAKKFPANSKLASDDVNNYLADQVIMRFATTTARDAAFGGVGEPTLAEGMTCYIDADNSIYTYDGANWIKVASTSAPAGSNPSGLERVTTCTVTSAGGTAATASNGVISVGTNNTSITIVNAFSSTYDNYRIVFAGGTASASDFAIQLRFANVTGHYSSMRYDSWAGVAGTLPASNQTFFYFGLSGDNYHQHMVLDVFSPNLAQYTKFSGFFTGANNVGTGGGVFAQTTQLTDLTIFGSSFNFTGGQIRVYGYRQ